MDWQMDSLVYGTGTGKLWKSCMVSPQIRCIAALLPPQPLSLVGQVNCHHLFLLDDPPAHRGTVLGAVGLPVSHVGPGIVPLARQLQRGCLFCVLSK